MKHTIATYTSPSANLLAVPTLVSLVRRSSLIPGRICRWLIWEIASLAAVSSDTPYGPLFSNRPPINTTFLSSGGVVVSWTVEVEAVPDWNPDRLESPSPVTYPDDVVLRSSLSSWISLGSDPLTVVFLCCPVKNKSGSLSLFSSRFV